jgi:hypothetical protein
MADLTKQVNEIRSNTKRMMRTVDASMGFCRGMAAWIGADESGSSEALGDLNSVSMQG